MTASAARKTPPYGAIALRKDIIDDLDKLAKKLGVTKPVITRALDAMGKQEIIARRRDEADRRNVIIQRTVKGALYVESLGDLIVEKAAHIANRG